MLFKSFFFPNGWIFPISFFLKKKKKSEKNCCSPLDECYNQNTSTIWNNEEKNALGIVMSSTKIDYDDVEKIVTNTYMQTGANLFLMYFTVLSTSTC